ncbi:hypothetical protein [Bacillus pseudomycoides]|uniref:hypothetical protein n=1 Tax=Bacillus pseudomycoides TaxID=64104 RepID=UPI000BED1FB6|nr:hypothetical protein [Bacillus pseudomycoides]PED09089.1 hypothetical protein COO19_06245 [Bacillus pseudomycoides]PEI97469.1 hypothetical protein CN686_08445 [Bacillus pseudomycoides]PEK29550.1 hypothetical protein CN693_01870 [Bacillus pseudomycoides]PEM71714.1 hypothetical protein CN619_18020 [Bacillus pseudomycoides]PEO23390.1 hypothetical protein CN542_01835 [Bacillus pseudomycoides]
MTTKYNRLHDLVLPGDFSFANKLHECMTTCIYNMFNAKSNEEANYWEEELNRCTNEFKMLREEKEEHEVSKSYRVIIKGLHSKGINVSLVSRRK